MTLVVRGTPKDIGEKIVIPLKEGWNILGWVNETNGTPKNYSHYCSPFWGDSITAWNPITQNYYPNPYFADDFIKEWELGWTIERKGLLGLG